MGHRVREMEQRLADHRSAAGEARPPPPFPVLTGQVSSLPPY